MFQVLGYLCGLQSFLCSCHSATSSHYDKMAESSTQFTLQETRATSRAVTNDTIARPGSRPAAPPAPRPIVRSQGQAGAPPLGLSNQNYRPPPRSHSNPRHTVMHNHVGVQGGAGPPYPHKRSASPDTPPALHRSYPPSPSPPSSPETPRGARRTRHNTGHPPRPRNGVKEAGGRDPVRDQLSPSDRTSVERPPWSPKEERPPWSPRGERPPWSPRGEPSKPPRPAPSPLHSPGYTPEHTAVHPPPHRPTGAIPKRRKTTGGPGALRPPHPDEILSVPLDDLSPCRATQAAQQLNFAH